MIIFHSIMLIFKKKLLHKNNKLMKKKVNKYKSAGVNITEGNNFIKSIKKKIFSTHKPGAIRDLGSFSGCFDLSKILFILSRFSSVDLSSKTIKSILFDG